MATVEKALSKLEKSKFRSKFKLNKNDIGYIEKNGMEKIRQHAYDFVSKRLSPAFLENDGRQTPTKGHPVFKAQHACACCCRGCLNKWYNVPKGVELTKAQQDKIVNLLIAWIEKQLKNQ